jgi:hypothetical protein
MVELDHQLKPIICHSFFLGTLHEVPICLLVFMGGYTPADLIPIDFLTGD